MAKDIAPILNEQIQTSFKDYCLKDRRISQISKRIRDGTADFVDAHDYAERLGENLSRALVNNLTAETLPNERLYYNIATRTITPCLEENYNLVNEVAADIQQIVDNGTGIGLGSVKADFPKERIQGLIDKMTSEDPLINMVVVWLKEPIINNSEAFVDDYIKENAKFRSEVGLKTQIIRRADSGACEWCRALAGSFDYDDMPQHIKDNIYRRHEFCRCTVTYVSEKTSQNVWTKRTWATSSQDLESRKSAGSVETLTALERISQAENIERDRVVSDFMKQTGYTRETARRSTFNKTPEEIAREIKKIKERQKIIRG